MSQLILRKKTLKILPKSFSELKHCGNNQNYQTRRLLNVPCFNTDTYERESAKYHYIIDWKNFLEKF